MGTDRTPVLKSDSPKTLAQIVARSIVDLNSKYLNPAISAHTILVKKVTNSFIESEILWHANSVCISYNNIHIFEQFKKKMVKE